MAACHPQLHALVRDSSEPHTCLGVWEEPGSLSRPKQMGKTWDPTT